MTASTPWPWRFSSSLRPLHGPGPQEADRDYEMWRWQTEMAADLTGSSIDALALGLREAD